MSPKKSKKEANSKGGKEKKRKGDKGKSRETDSEFKVINASLVVSIPPVFSNTPRTGVEEMLDSMIMRYLHGQLSRANEIVNDARYIPAFEGVVLAHSNLCFLDQVATIKADCPFAICKVGFEAIVWSPRIAMKLSKSPRLIRSTATDLNRLSAVGKVNLYSPDHISLLVHQTFNVSIPRHHIPTAEWEFEYGPVENDPEFGADVDEVMDNQGGKPESGGRWVHKVTGENLGGPEGYLEFTVVGYDFSHSHLRTCCAEISHRLTVANEMLSLLGSVQHDPFSPEHVPRNAQSVGTPSPASEDEVAQITVGGSDDDESDGDVFTHLGKMGDEAVVREARRQEEEEAVRKEKKKRKRKQVSDLSSNKPKRKRHDSL
jgi:DNA-directed RNA polymerase I subunit RPA43